MSQPDYLISTPENVDLHLELAGIGNRVYACLVDSLLGLAMMLLVVLVGVILSGAVLNLFGNNKIGKLLIYIVIGLGILVELAIYFGYYIVFEGFWQGQTPGKRLAQIRVIEQNGQPAGWSSVFIRNLVRVIDMGVALMGLIVMLVDRNERRLGDLAAGTLVIRERFSEKAPHIELAANRTVDGLVDVGRLRPQEYDLLVSFLERREQMSSAYRPLLAKKLETYFRDRLQETSRGESSEYFLEQLYLAYRCRAD